MSRSGPEHGTILEEALAPGCSLATMRPIATVAPVADQRGESGQSAQTEAARWRDSAEGSCGGDEVISSAVVLGSAWLYGRGHRCHQA